MTREKRAVLAIALVGFFSPIGVAIASGLAYLQDAYNGIDKIWIQLLLIGPTLIHVPFNLVTSKLCAKFGAKPVIVAGELLCTAAGILPLFVRNYPLVLLSRLVMGTGGAMYGTAVTGLVYTAYTDYEQRGKVNGYLQAFGYVGSITFMVIGGLLSDIHWSYCFLIYLVGLPLAWYSYRFLPDEIIKKEPDGGGRVFIPIKKEAWIYILLIGGQGAFNAIFSNNISGFIIGNGFGNATTAGLSGSVESIMGFTGCLLGYAIYRKTGRWIVGIAAIVSGTMYMILSRAGSMPAIFIILALLGFSCSIRAPLFGPILGEIMPAHTMTFVCGVSSVFESLTSSIIVLGFTKIFAQGSNGNERHQFLAVGIAIVVIGILMLIKEIFGKKEKRIYGFERNHQR